MRKQQLHTLHGHCMDIVWTLHGHWMDIEWTLNGYWMDHIAWTVHEQKSIMSKSASLAFIPMYFINNFRLEQFFWWPGWDLSQIFQQSCVSSSKIYDQMAQESKAGVHCWGLLLISDASLLPRFSWASVWPSTVFAVDANYCRSSGAWTMDWHIHHQCETGWLFHHCHVQHFQDQF
jgi:hypothetical protein